MKRTLIIAALLVIARLASASWVENLPQTLRQPDGKIINCLASGDEFYHWLHDANGFTIVLNPADGFFYYGITSGETVVPSKYKAGTVNPARVGLRPWAKISEAQYARQRASMETPLKSGNQLATKGVINTVCIYISFADDSLFTFDRAYYKEMWSATDKPSVQDYFRETSYGQLDLQVNHFPLSPDTVTLCYKDIHNRNYYLPKTETNPNGYDGDSGDRERGMLKRAADFVRPQIPSGLNLDMNGDGSIDNICFVIQGNASAWATLLWPHATGMYSYNVQLNGARINSYFLTLEKGFGATTMCHELGHVFGAPDLYHYSNSGKTGPTAVGTWCLMDANADPPQSICGFLKYKYNHWITDLPEITESGVYSLKPLTSPTNNLYKIKSPYSRTEYFVLEYRRKEGRYEKSAPGTGLVVYRINPNAGNGNAGGPPDEVYVYRPDGNLVETGSLNSAGMAAPTRTAINDKTNPDSYLYNNGQGGTGGLDLFNVSAAGDSITFEVRIIDLFPPHNLNYIPSEGVCELTWKPSMVSGLSKYNIYRNGVLYGTSNSSSFRDSNISLGQTYSYYVTAYYDGVHTGESEPTSTVTYTPMGIQSLPYTEDFEDIGHGWKIKGNVEGFQWGDATSLGMATSNTSRFIGANSVAAGLATKCTDYAITPRLNMQDKTKVYIHFDYTLKRWQQLDHLKVAYRPNQYEVWTTIIDLPLSPIGGTYRWKKYNLEIPVGAYTDEAQLGFQYDDGDGLGFGAAIDNVVIDEQETSGIETTSGNLSVNIFPNPAGEQATLDISGTNGNRLTMRLVSIDGKTIQSELNQSVRDGQQTISLAGLAGGLYYVVIESDEEVIIRSLIKK